MTLHKPGVTIPALIHFHNVDVVGSHESLPNQLQDIITG